MCSCIKQYAGINNMYIIKVYCHLQFYFNHDNKAIQVIYFLEQFNSLVQQFNSLVSFPVRWVSNGSASLYTFFKFSQFF